MPSPVLILPGYGNSGAAHWQTRWERTHHDFLRVQQHDWLHPVRTEWVAALEAAVQAAGPSVVLVAHSLGCLLVAHWAAQAHSPVKAALLVAVPDATSPKFPNDAVGFSDTPMLPLLFPSTVVVSSDDPFCAQEYVIELAQAWKSTVVPVGNRGHINADSGLDDWPEGMDLLAALRR